MTTTSRTTPLHSWHVKNGASMATFGTYDMPLWYPQGAKQEHLSVLTTAGLFDTSHMAVLLVAGTTARHLLQYCFSKDLDHCLGRKKLPLCPGRCVYGLFLDARGHVVDDAIVYQLDERSFMVVVNANMNDTVSTHLAAHNAGAQTRIRDMSDQLGKIDIQGPQAARVLAEILMDGEKILADMTYFSFKGYFLASDSSVFMTNAVPVLISRTGYTGEFGFELFVPQEHLVATWQLLLTAGAGHHITPCGLAARDSLRTGAMLPLSHQDIGDWPFQHNPWLFALPFNDSASGFTKDFLGAKAILNNETAPSYTFAFAGYDPRKIPLSDNCSVVDAAGHTIGSVLTCVTDMGIGRVNGVITSIASPQETEQEETFVPRGLCCGFVRVNRALSPGEEVTLTDTKRTITVEIREEIRPHRTARKAMGEMI